MSISSSGFKLSGCHFDSMSAIHSDRNHNTGHRREFLAKDISARGNPKARSFCAISLGTVVAIPFSTSLLACQDVHYHLDGYSSIAWFEFLNQRFLVEEITDLRDSM